MAVKLTDGLKFDGTKQGRRVGNKKLLRPLGVDRRKNKAITLYFVETLKLKLMNAALFARSQR